MCTAFKIRRRIDSPEAADGVHIAGIGDNGRHRFQLIEF
jgi:hypothetical protein